MVCADGPPTVGLVVAMSAPLPLGFIDVTCRVVSVVDEPNRFGFGFGYGTLPIHPGQGEESFTVERDDDGEVTFRIVAVSRPRHPLTRLCPPVARRLQRAAIERYLDANDRRRAASRERRRVLDVRAAQDARSRRSCTIGADVQKLRVVDARAEIRGRLPTVA